MIKNKLASLLKNSNKLALGLPRLVINAEKIASTVYYGLHGTKKQGQGEDFWQFRNYEYGDPVSLIDWRKTAASERTLIKEEEKEIAQTITLFCDRSASMEYKSENQNDSKLFRSQLLALSMAVLLIKSGEKVLVSNNDKNNTSSKSNIKNIAEELTSSKNSLCYPNLDYIKNKTLLIIFSDFFYDIKNIKKLIRNLNKKEVVGYLIQVLDPTEESLPFKGKVMFQSMENLESFTIGKVEATAKDYRNKLRLHKSLIQNLTYRNRCSFFTHITKEKPEDLILRLYKDVSKHRNKIVKHF